MFSPFHLIRILLVIGILYVWGITIFPYYEDTNSIVSIFAVENTYAATNAAPLNTQNQPEEVNLISLIDNFIRLVSVMVTPMISFAGWLLSPDWTHGELFGLRDILYKIWVMTSNLAYFWYAFLLVISAIATMFWPEKSGLQLWALLPRLAIGILFIPFTLWIINATLSVTNIITTSVIGIPYDMIKKGEVNVQGTTWFSTDKVIPRQLIIDLEDSNNASATAAGTKASLANQKLVCGEWSDCMTVEEFMKGLNTGPYSLLVGYAYSVFRMNNYKVISDGLLKTLTSGGKVLIVTLFAVITYVAFSILIFALCFVLFMRAIRMWFFIAFSPFITFYYVLNSKGEKLSKASMDLKSFFGLAFVPIIVSAALSFGFLFISLMNGVIMTQETANANANSCKIACQWWTLDGKAIMDGDGCLASGKTGEKQIATSGFKIGELSFCIVGQLMAWEESKTSEPNVLATIISSFLGLAVLWLAVRGALESTTVTQNIMKPLSWLLDLTQSLPKYIPIPWLPWGSLAWTANSTKMVENMMKQSLDEKVRNDYNNSLIGRLVPADLSNNDNTAMNTMAQRWINPRRAEEQKNRFTSIIQTSWQTEWLGPTVKKYPRQIYEVIKNTDDATFRKAWFNESQIMAATRLRAKWTLDVYDHQTQRDLAELIGQKDNSDYLRAIDSAVQTTAGTDLKAKFGTNEVDLGIKSSADHDKIGERIVNAIRNNTDATFKAAYNTNRETEIDKIIDNMASLDSTKRTSIKAYVKTNAPPTI